MKIHLKYYWYAIYSTSSNAQWQLKKPKQNENRSAFYSRPTLATFIRENILLQSDLGVRQIRMAVLWSHNFDLGFIATYHSLLHNWFLWQCLHAKKLILPKVPWYYTSVGTEELEGQYPSTARSNLIGT